MRIWCVVQFGIGDRIWRALGRRDDGQDIVEYALLAGLVSIVAVGIIVLLGPVLRNAFQDIINAVNSA